MSAVYLVQVFLLGDAGGILLFYSLHFFPSKTLKIPLIILGGFTQQIFIIKHLTYSVYARCFCF